MTGGHPFIPGLAIPIPVWSDRYRPTRACPVGFSVSGRRHRVSCPSLQKNRLYSPYRRCERDHRRLEARTTTVWGVIPIPTAPARTRRPRHPRDSTNNGQGYLNSWSDCTKPRIATPDKLLHTNPGTTLARPPLSVGLPIPPYHP